MGDQINKHGMCGVYGMQMGEDKCVRNLSGDARRIVTKLDIALGGWILLKCILKEMGWHGLN